MDLKRAGAWLGQSDDIEPNEVLEILENISNQLNQKTTLDCRGVSASFVVGQLLQELYNLDMSEFVAALRHDIEVIRGEFSSAPPPP
ncbi:MAG: hypothetical protein COV52_00265 [Gammaproteobacteria bacterium CG11_big_fil_rev_8_21_14_0_20_46_22]|nr:MAG: hypothetical protein COW05_09240 [Gammaproteobacteria bacterium CG12_big_fil_rev_8_21_14_0_65_46_12]PIR12093.1 MAG: hypothetical protein COV52_00265 [Gammaproteobacteria bacterium CG11_big_fil_rev_8_21_14_0_20_46_22]